MGGGDMFETEEVFAPSGPQEYDIDLANRQLWERGMPRNLLAFHSGLHVSAIDGRGQVVKVDAATMRPVGAFSSVDEWYADLRREYASTYGLVDG